MSIVIPESHLGHLKEAYVKIYQDYLQRRKLIEAEWNELQPILQKLNIPTSNGALQYTLKADAGSISIKGGESKFTQGIKPFSDLSWFKKAEIILKQHNKSMTSNEIIDILISEYQPDLSKQTATNSLPATLSVAAKEGRINREINENGEYEYSLK